MIKTSHGAVSSLAPVFTPSSVAVVGASPTNMWGRQALDNFARLSFPGKVAAVNPKYQDIAGFPCYPSLREMPFVPEAVLVGVNRERVVAVVEEAAQVGAKGAVIFAIGFAEAGPEGRRMQERLTEVATAAGMAVIGPNCQGVINFAYPCAMYMGVVQPYKAGHVGLFAQSGSVTTVLANNKRGVRWSHIVSSGNEAVSDSGDIIGYYVDDPQTKVICGFIETIRNPEHFFHQCGRARAAGKPVIVQKSGRTEAARAAATAHSGALSAPDRLYDELFRRHGVLRVDSTEELLETAIALQSKRLPAGGRVAAITGSGGQIELILDATGEHPGVLSHPEFEPGTKSFLRDILPEFLTISNPLDYWGVADFIGTYPKLLAALAQDANIDIVVGIADTNSGPTGSGGGDERAFREATELAGKSPKLITLLAPTDGQAPAGSVETLLDKEVLLLSGFQEGFRAIERLVTWTKPLAATSIAPNFDTAGIAKRLDELKGQSLSGLPALEILALVGIPTVGSVAVGSVEAAVTAAEEIGYPVVVKIGDVEILHKTEAGGVILNLCDAVAVSGAASRLLAAGAKTVLVQSQVTSGVEMLLGLQSDPMLGSFVLAGLGGIWTEVMNDVAIRPVGLLDGEAAAMTTGLRSRKLLEGVRGAPASDIGALTDAISRVDAIGRIFGLRLEAIDINPLVVLPSGVVAVDALIVPRRETANKRHSRQSHGQRVVPHQPWRS